MMYLISGSSDAKKAIASTDCQEPECRVEEVWRAQAERGRCKEGKQRASKVDQRASKAHNVKSVEAARISCRGSLREHNIGRMRARLAFASCLWRRYSVPRDVTRQSFDLPVLLAGNRRFGLQRILLTSKRLHNPRAESGESRKAPAEAIGRHIAELPLVVLQAQHLACQRCHESAQQLSRSTIVPSASGRHSREVVSARSALTPAATVS